MTKLFTGPIHLIGLIILQAICHIVTVVGAGGAIVLKGFFPFDKDHAMRMIKVAERTQRRVGVRSPGQQRE